MNSQFNLFSRCFGILLIGVALAACTTNPYTGEREATNAAKAAGIGAAIGAVVGILSGDDGDERRKRALIGAGIGALGGAAVGAYMDAQETKLRQQLAGTGVSVERYGDSLILHMPGNITFPVDQYEIRGDFYPVLNSVALVLAEYKKTLIDITGHTDSTGSYQHNMALSQRRADSVAQYLQAQRVEPVRIMTKGVGPDFPAGSNATPEGRQLNRRVELVLRPLTVG